MCTDEILKAKLEEIIRKVQRTHHEQSLAEVKKHVRLNTGDDDARNRILILNASYLKFCKKRVWTFYKDAQKASIKHICAVLQPPDLSSRVESALKLEKKS